MRDTERRNGEKSSDWKKPLIAVSLAAAIGLSGCGLDKNEGFRGFVAGPLPKPQISQVEASDNTKTPTRWVEETQTLTPAPTSTETPMSTPTPTATPTETRIPTSKYQEILTSEGKLFFNSEGNPVKYISVKGEETLFDTPKAQNAKNEAVKTGQPVIFTEIPVPVENDFIPSFAHPIVEKLPDDALNKEDLAAINIHIINTKEVQFFIRKSALEEGGSLEQFKDGKNPLLIVLIDGNVTSPIFMKGLPESVRNVFGEPTQEVGSYRKGKIVEYQEKIDNDQKSFENQIVKYKVLNETPNPNESELKDYQDRILAYKLERYYYDNISDKDLTFEMARKETDKTGMYTKNYFYTIDGIIYNTAIFICVGGSNPNTKQIVLYYTRDGQLQVQIYSPNRSFLDLRPDPKQIYPNPADIKTNPKASIDNPSSNIYFAITPGEVWHHEVVHADWLEKKVKGIDVPPFDNEYEVSKHAFELIGKAWKKWNQGNDSGYDVGFSRSGRYILTQNKTETNADV